MWKDIDTGVNSLFEPIGNKDSFIKINNLFFGNYDEDDDYNSPSTVTKAFNGSSYKMYLDIKYCGYDDFPTLIDTLGNVFLDNVTFNSPVILRRGGSWIRNCRLYGNGKFQFESSAASYPNILFNNTYETTPFIIDNTGGTVKQNGNIQV